MDLEYEEYNDGDVFFVEDDETEAPIQTEEDPPEDPITTMEAEPDVVPLLPPEEQRIENSSLLRDALPLVFTNIEDPVTKISFGHTNKTLKGMFNQHIDEKGNLLPKRRFSCQCASRGFLSLLAWGKDNRCTLTSHGDDITGDAAKNGHMNILHWLHQNDPHFDFSTTFLQSAAYGGHLDIIMWARELDCAWTPTACSGAARGGHLKILQYLRANGCPWNDAVCYNAALSGSPETLMWAVNQGCDWGSYLVGQGPLEILAQKGDLDTLQWARSTRCPFQGNDPSNAAIAAIPHNHVFKWLVTHPIYGFLSLNEPSAFRLIRAIFKKNAVFGLQLLLQGITRDRMLRYLNTHQKLLCSGPRNYELVKYLFDNQLLDQNLRFSLRLFIPQFIVANALSNQPYHRKLEVFNWIETLVPLNVTLETLFYQAPIQELGYSQYKTITQLIIEKRGSLRTLQWLRSKTSFFGEGYPYIYVDPKEIDIDMKGIVQKFIGFGKRWHPKSLAKYSKNQQWDALKWCLDVGNRVWCQCYLPRGEQEDDCDHHTDLVYYATKCEQKGLLLLLRELGCPWNSTMCAAAAADGKLNLLQWLVDNGCEWNEKTCCAAAKGGHIRVLSYARERGCPCGTVTRDAAKKHNQIEVLDCLWKWGIRPDLETEKYL